MAENGKNLSILIHRAVFLIQHFRPLLESYVTVSVVYAYEMKDYSVLLLDYWDNEKVFVQTC